MLKRNIPQKAGHKAAKAAKRPSKPVVTKPEAKPAKAAQKEAQPKERKETKEKAAQPVSISAAVIAKAREIMKESNLAEVARAFAKKLDQDEIGALADALKVGAGSRRHLMRVAAVTRG